MPTKTDVQNWAKILSSVIGNVEQGYRGNQFRGALQEGMQPQQTGFNEVSGQSQGVLPPGEQTPQGSTATPLTKQPNLLNVLSSIVSKRPELTQFAEPMIEQQYKSAMAAKAPFIEQSPGQLATNVMTGETIQPPPFKPSNQQMSNDWQAEMDVNNKPVEEPIPGTNATRLREFKYQMSPVTGKMEKIYRYSAGGTQPNAPMYTPASQSDINEMAKAAANYELDLNSVPRQDKSKVIAAARRLNPKLNQINYNTNRQLKQQYTSGKIGNNIISLNTGIGHLQSLREAARALKNNDVQLLNSIAVRFGRAVGKSAPDQFEAVRDAVANELSTTFKGTSGTDIGLQSMLKTMYSSQSPQQVEGVVQTFVKLLDSRLSALNSNYKKQTGVDYPVLDEDKKPIVSDILGQPTQSNLPVVGEIQDGFKFKGGNPQDPNSWEEIK